MWFLSLFIFREIILESLSNVSETTPPWCKQETLEVFPETSRHNLINTSLIKSFKHYSNFLLNN